MRNPLARLRLKLALALRDVHATRRELAELRAGLAGAMQTMDHRNAETLRALESSVEELRTLTETLTTNMATPGQHQIPLRAMIGETAEGWQVGDLRRRLDEVLGEVRRAIDAIQVVYDQEPDNRRRLHALRETVDYGLAFSEAEPLISVLIPTYRSFETLRERAIPSVLTQTYENWELIVVGDGAPPETAEVVSAFGDPRIRYENQPMRGPYPEDDYDAWLVTAVPPFNAGLRLARGRWIAPFADDDAFRPDALRSLLYEAQRLRHEFCYAKLLLHARDGKTEEIGAYPPRLAKAGISAGMQGALLHSGLRFFEQELADAIFQTPSDWSLMRRMLRAGVRFGFLDTVTCDYFPSYRGEDVPGGRPFR